MRNLKIIILFLTIVFFSACQKNNDWTAKSFKTENGWGYAISNSGRTYIKQSIIPVISENKSFSTESDAMNTASMVIEKLKSGKSPSITKADLKKLNIID